MAELKCCPFCGGEAKISKSSYGHSADYYTTEYRIGCVKCCFDFKATSVFGVKDGVPYISVDGYKEIVDKWNTRPPQKEEQNGRIDKCIQAHLLQ